MRKNGFVVMGHLLKLVTPLAHIMAFTITMGTLGFLAAIFIMVLGAMGLVNLLNFDTHLSFSGILTALIVLAVARGALRYLEQMSGHYIAFKLLALLRDKVFSSLRRLAFVKLQDKQAGQLVSLVTNDIELLEVFYAHTIIAGLCTSFRLVCGCCISRLFNSGRDSTHYYHQIGA